MLLVVCYRWAKYAVIFLFSWATRANPKRSNWITSLGHRVLQLSSAMPSATDASGMKTSQGMQVPMGIQWIRVAFIFFASSWDSLWKTASIQCPSTFSI